MKILNLHVETYNYCSYCEKADDFICNFDDCSRWIDYYKEPAT